MIPSPKSGKHKLQLGHENLTPYTGTCNFLNQLSGIFPEHYLSCTEVLKVHQYLNLLQQQFNSRYFAFFIWPFFIIKLWNKYWSIDQLWRFNLHTFTYKLKLHGLSPRANYTDRATAASRRSGCQILRMKGATWSAWRIPTAVFSVF
jgi:hypothetical protein